MPVNIDTVYQRVLAIANKEQRGYITPLEFNLLANQAQMEIIDQYFYDINQFHRLHGNEMEYSDMLSLIKEKLSVLERIDDNIVVDAITGSASISTGSGSVYKIGTIATRTTDPEHDDIEVEEVDYKEYKLIAKTSIGKPTLKRPVYYKHKNGVNIFPTNVGLVSFNYIEMPNKVAWGYVVDLNGNALYNPAFSTDFSLHVAEQSELVYKILKLAGVTIQRQDISAAGLTGEMSQIQQEKQ